MNVKANRFTWLRSPLINSSPGSAGRTTMYYPIPSLTLLSYPLLLISVPEHCLLSWLILFHDSYFWLILLNPWPWTLPRSYLYKEPILSCSSLVLTLVPIWFNPLCFSHKPLEVPFAWMELNSLLLSLLSTERKCKLVMPVTKGQNYFCVCFSKRRWPHHVKTPTVSLAKEAPSLEEDRFVWN